MITDKEKWAEELTKLTKTLKTLKALGDDVTSWACAVIIEVLLSKDTALQEAMVSALLTFSKVLNDTVPDGKADRCTFTHPGSSAVN